MTTIRAEGLNCVVVTLTTRTEPLSLSSLFSFSLYIYHRARASMSSVSSFAAISSPPSSLNRASFASRLSSPFPFRHNTRFGVKCSYAEAGVKEDSNSGTIDVVADVKTERVVVLGGSGFVGSAICKAAVSKGIEAISLSRSGRPSYSSSWVDQVTWMSGDVFYANWDEVLAGATAVVSTLGGFGSEEQMQRINGEANVVAVTAAKDFGIPKFILISVHDYNLPSFLLSSGYFTGKRKAESEVLSKYPTSGVVLRPGFIYGKRRVDGFEIPLDLIGGPLERFLQATENFTKPLSSLPGSDLLLAPPVSVDDVAFAVINAITDDDFFGIFTIEQIKEAAAKVRV
ncbi:uncharacterized protein At1g32220, chloroplastic isoform X1 [Camellia sinensis]|uniref:uncharacterized protein At1g32220, chloroplastic isoform X1 n=2 Tax=Camellia sinensis TaxID=4442 RepID=UPI001035645E|nr:uncharacterized protein At1g32220, chloroplastic isoform X1 [Camellia sinensis]XP_028076020.1 uncharacterized protein At1g32220, chloroplastic isoform X1 [Camellia sinensis]